MFKQEQGNVFSNKNDTYMPLFNTKWSNVGGREKGLIKRFFYCSLRIWKILSVVPFFFSNC